MGSAKDFILCPINGAVEFDENEMALLNTPTLRRLQYIKQLEFTYLVFPGCNHTRFEHTVGVTHLLKELCKKEEIIDYLFNTMDIDWAQLGLKSKRNKFKKKFIKKFVPLCGIMHDIGHGPFSHLSELIFMSANFPAPKPYEDDINFQPEKRKAVKSLKLHEWIMYEILSFPETPSPTIETYFNNRLRNSFEDITDNYNTVNIKHAGKKGLEKWYNFLKSRHEDIKGPLKKIAGSLQIIEKNEFGNFLKYIAYGACGMLNGLKDLMYGELDMDRLDYLRRDSFMAGVKYGNIELDRLLDASFIFEDKKILIDFAKGIASLEHMYTGRLLFYFTTIHHPCSTITRNMVLKFIHKLEGFQPVLEQENSKKDWLAIFDFLAEIFDMEDLDFIEYLRANDPADKGTKKYIERLINRDIYKKIAVLHWNDLYPHWRKKLHGLAKEKNYYELWKETERIEDNMGKVIYAQLVRSSSSLRDYNSFIEEHGKVILLNLPFFEEKPPDVDNIVVRRKNLQNVLSFQKAMEISPLLSVSDKMMMRNQLVSVHLNPDLLDVYEKYRKKIKKKAETNQVINTISRKFWCYEFARKN